MNTLLESQMKAVQDAPDFGEALRTYRGMVDLANQSLAPFRAERDKLAETYCRTLDAACRTFNERLRALEIMVDIVGKVAASSSSTMMLGTDFTQDARAVIGCPGIELVRSFETLTLRFQKAHDEPNSFDARAAAAGRAAELLAQNPDFFGTRPRDSEDDRQVAALDRLANSLRVYALAKYCAQHGGTELIEAPRITPWIARRYGGPAIVDGELGLSTEEVRFPTKSFVGLNMILEGLRGLDFTEEEFRAHNRADQVVWAALFTCFNHSSAEVNVRSQEWRDGLLQLRAELAQIADGTHPVAPEYFDLFSVTMLSLRCSMLSIAEQRWAACAQVWEEHRPGIDEIKTRERAYAAEVAQPLLNRAFDHVLSRELPGQRPGLLDPDSQRALRRHWSWRVRRTLNFTRLLTDPTSGQLHWASDLKARARWLDTVGGTPVDGIQERNNL